MRVHRNAFATASSSSPAEDSVPPPAVHDRSIGDHLREVRELSDGQIGQIVEYQQARRLRFGEAAVALGLATTEDIAWALSQQFHYPYVPEKRRHKNPEVVVSSDPFSALAEVFRDLCSQVVAKLSKVEPARRALAVVSPDVGDGKTFVAANLAVALSQVGGRTLLVDADMRSPRQHLVFGLSGQFGLSNILAGRSPSNVIQSVPDLPNLFLLPVGMMPPNPLELLQRPSFRLLLRELLAKFDHIVVDTPARSRSADARVIAASCGSALVVGRKGRTRLAALQQLGDSLHTAQAGVAGVILNEV